MRKIELVPIASIARECKPSPRRKRTPTGSCDRIVAPPAPESCPVDITGRYQSNAEPGDPNGRPMNVQINQAGDHVEFQVFLFPAKAGDDTTVHFGGGEYNYGEAAFDVWFYKLEPGHDDVASFTKDTAAGEGTLTPRGGDRVDLVLKAGTKRRDLGASNQLLNIGDGPTPFTQSLPGVFRDATKRRKASAVTLASTLWWPLLPFQVRRLEKDVKKIESRLKTALENSKAELDDVINNVAQVEIALVRAMYGFGEIRPHEQVGLTRILLRLLLNRTEITFDKEKTSLLVLLDRTIRLGKERGGKGVTDREFKHPILDRGVPLFAAELKPDRNGIRNVPEWMRLGVGAERTIEFEAKLTSMEGAAGYSAFEGNVMISYLEITRLTPPKWEGKYGLVATGVGVGIGSPHSIKGSVDRAKATSAYDWGSDDISGVAWIGETGGSGVVSGVGPSMSEEGITLFGNAPDIPVPLHFDFGDIELTSVEGVKSNTDVEFGYDVGAGTNLLVGRCFTIKELKLKRHIIKLEDVQIENATKGSGVVGFEFGSALLNGAGRDVIRSLACRELHGLMQPHTSLRVVAHADLPDTYDRNIELTYLRARNTIQAFKDVLGKKLKVDAKHLGIAGMGEIEAYQDWVTQSMAAGRLLPDKENPDFRRADITIDGRVTTRLRGAGKPKT